MKQLIIYLFIILLPLKSFIYGQSIIFDNPFRINELNLAKPYNLLISDIDNDNKSDILITSPANNYIFIIKKEGNNPTKFGNLKLIKNSFNETGLISAADIDKDGDIDLVVGDNRGNEMAWFENTDGKGLFLQKEINNKTDGITCLIPADIDDDGDIDIIVSYLEGERISYFENIDAKGGFSDEKPIDLQSGGIAQVAFKDINGDSKKDIIVLKKTDNEIVWYENNGTANNFTKINPIATNALRPSSMTVEDVDNDGDFDIVAALQSKVVLYKNNDGNGNFSEDSEIYNNNNSIKNILIRDIDNDNDKDIILGDSEAGKILVFFNSDGNGTYGKDTVILNNFDGVYGLELIDFDGDNILDICAASYYGHKLVWMKGLNEGNFSPPELISESLLQEPKQILTGDFNSDYNRDIVVSNNRKNNLAWYKNTNNGNPFEFNIIRKDDSATKRIIEKADFDNDGDPDIISVNANYGLSILLLYENTDGKGNFKSKSILLNNSPSISFIKSGDLDNDGYIDILFISQDKNLIAYARNLGNGKFDKNFITITNNINNPTGLSINDFDNDDDLDIICSSNSENKILYFENNNGNFTLKNINIPNPVISPLYITSADINGDKNIDILYCSSNGGIFWMKNINGNGFFSNAIKLIDNYYYPGIIIAEDIDHDGDTDIFVKERIRKNILWFENIDGKGNFSTPYIIFNSIDGIEDIKLADMDGDSFKDFVSLNSEQNSIFFNKAFPAPVFTRQPTDKSICKSGQVNFQLDYDKADSLRWQVKKTYTNQFNNIYDNDIYSGTQNNSLSVKATTDMDKYKYRCVLFFKNHKFISDTVELKVYTFIEANAGKDDSTCFNTFSLHSNNPAQGTGKWTIVTGSAKITSPDHNETDVTDLTIGLNTFRWTINNGLCTDFDDVSIERKEEIDITEQPENLQLKNGQNATFNIVVTGDVESYQWEFNGIPLNDDENISGSKTNILTIKNVRDENKGTYKCKIKGYCNSITSDDVVLDIISNTFDSKIKKISISPNPAIDFINIKSDMFIKNLTIFDINNKIIKTETGNIKKINTSGLNPGIYIIKIKTNKNTFRFKFIKL